jgi:hypothetical protein
MNVRQTLFALVRSDIRHSDVDGIVKLFCQRHHAVFMGKFTQVGQYFNHPVL